MHQDPYSHQARLSQTARVLGITIPNESDWLVEGYVAGDNLYLTSHKCNSKVLIYILQSRLLRENLFFFLYLLKLFYTRKDTYLNIHTTLPVRRPRVLQEPVETFYNHMALLNVVQFARKLIGLS